MKELDKTAARDLWLTLRSMTQARIAVGRVGDALPTGAVMAFEVAQAQARDAVRVPLDVSAVEAALVSLGLATLNVASRATDRAMYLRRPDAGRRLSDASRQLLLSLPRRVDDGLTVVVADGLSAAAPLRHAGPLLAALLDLGVRINPPIFVATQTRVALGDEIGELVGAQAVLMLVGERPGLTTPASLGAYLTWGPRLGRTDAERNCVSNIHANGLGYAETARKLALLLGNARKLGATGVELHDEAHEAIPGLPGTSAAHVDISTSLRFGQDDNFNR